MESTVGKDSADALDLEQQPRVLVGCRLCGSKRSRLVCSAQDIAAQQRFLESFYRSRWSQQDESTATDRLTFTQDYATAIVACENCGLLYRNPRPPSQAVEPEDRRRRDRDARIDGEPGHRQQIHGDPSRTV